MIVPGEKCSIKATPETVAKHTIECLTSSVPHSIAGVVFLSGGQSGIEALLNLNAIAQIQPTPWPLTFSFDRVFMLPVLQAWAGKKENIQKSQDVLLHTLKQASDATSGSLSL